MIALLCCSFMPIVYVIDRIHNDFKFGDEVPTKVKCVFTWTRPYLQFVSMQVLTFREFRQDALMVATHNRPLTDLEAKTK